MIKELGTFVRYDDPRRNGSTFRNEHGLDWQRMVFTRVLFNDFGMVLELYEENSNTLIEGPRTFAAVADGVVTMAVTRDVSALLAALPALIIETDEVVNIGDLYTGGVVSPAPVIRIIHKSDVMLGLSDENYATWDERWAKLTPRQRVMWDNATSFYEGTDAYREAQAMLVGLIGPEAYTFFPK